MSGSTVFNAFAKKTGNRGRFLVLLSSCAIVLPLQALAQNAEETDAGTMLKPIILQGDGSPVGPDSTIVAKKLAHEFEDRHADPRFSGSRFGRH
ncbi:hypothetical protein [Rhizobium sp. ZW T2_16]|jgi:iron complex outermembrane receptor protein|uniref:hypothetical protein n=1 Tax=Rhizobium sp. ZW T2_16 TaxID=3378083 RepID=UPI0038531257